MICDPRHALRIVSTAHQEQRQRQAERWARIAKVAAELDDEAPPPMSDHEAEELRAELRRLRAVH